MPEGSKEQRSPKWYLWPLAPCRLANQLDWNFLKAPSEAHIHLSLPTCYLAQCLAHLGHLTHVVGYLLCQEGNFQPYLTPLLVLTGSARSFLTSTDVFWDLFEMLVRLSLPDFSCLSWRGLFQVSCLWFPTLLTLACEGGIYAQLESRLDEACLSHPVNFDLEECVLAPRMKFHFKTQTQDTLQFLLENWSSFIC